MVSYGKTFFFIFYTIDEWNILRCKTIGLWFHNMCSSLCAWIRSRFQQSSTYRRIRQIESGPILIKQYKDVFLWRRCCIGISFGPSLWQFEQQEIVRNFPAKKLTIWSWNSVSWLFGWCLFVIVGLLFSWFEVSVLKISPRYAQFFEFVE